MTGSRGAAEALAPGARVNGYRVDRLISAGGFGMVYRAVDSDQARIGRRRDLAERRRAAWAAGGYGGPAPDFGPVVAIKECLPSAFVSRASGASQIAVSASKRASFQWALRRFDDEARFLTGQSHPAIVTGWEAFSENGTRYLVMEALSGATLEQQVDTRGAQSEAAIRHWLRPLLRALQSTEAIGVNHLDISPSNILFRGAGADPVLIDFGASRFGSARRGQVSYSIVNDGYSAPEKTGMTSAGLDARCDVYSLAAVVLYALTGEAPPAAGEREESSASLKLALDAARRLGSGGFVDAVAQCLAMAPSARPADAKQMERRLFGDNGSRPDTGEDGSRKRPVGRSRLQAWLDRRNIRLEPLSRRSLAAVLFIASGIVVIILLAASIP